MLFNTADERVSMPAPWEWALAIIFIVGLFSAMYMEYKVDSAAQAAEVVAEQRKLADFIANNPTQGVPAVLSRVLAQMQYPETAKVVDWSDVALIGDNYQVRYRIKAQQLDGTMGEYNRVYVLDKTGAIISQIDVKHAKNMDSKLLVSHK